MMIADCIGMKLGLLYLQERLIDDPDAERALLFNFRVLGIADY